MMTPVSMIVIGGLTALLIGLSGSLVFDFLAYLRDKLWPKR